MSAGLCASPIGVIRYQADAAAYFQRARRELSRTVWGGHGHALLAGRASTAPW